MGTNQTGVNRRLLARLTVALSEKAVEEESFKADSWKSLGRTRSGSNGDCVALQEVVKRDEQMAHAPALNGRDTAGPPQGPGCQVKLVR